MLGAQGYSLTGSAHTARAHKRLSFGPPADKRGSCLCPVYYMSTGWAVRDPKAEGWAALTK